MKLLIHINQKESIRKGENAPDSTQVFDLDPGCLPDDLRDFFAEHLDLKTGELGWGFGAFGSNGRWLTITIPITKEAVIAEIAAMKAVKDAHLAQVKANEEENKRKITAETLAVLKDRKVTRAETPVRVQRQSDGSISVKRDSNYHSGTEYGRTASYPWAAWPYYRDNAVLETEEAKAWLLELDAAKEKAIAEATAIAVEAMERAEKATLEAEQKAVRLTAQLEAALIRLGTPIQRERHKRGLLDLEKDMTAAISREAFAPLNDIPAIRPVAERRTQVVADLDEDDAENYGISDVTWKNRETCGTITDAEMELILKIESILPDVEVEVLNQNGVIETDAEYLASVNFRWLSVTLHVGELTLSRNYASPSEG